MPWVQQETSTVAAGAVNTAREDITDVEAGQSPRTVQKILILISLFLVYFVVFAAYAVYAPFFPSEARDKGVSGTIVGLIFGAYPFVVFVFAPFFGALLPKYGAPFVLLTGMFMCGGSLILFGFCGMISNHILFIVFCFLLRITSAIGGAACETSALSIVLETFPNNVGAVMGATETFTGIGFSLGPVLGGLLYTVGGFKLPFIVIGSVMIAVMPPLFILLINKENQSTPEQSTSICKALRIPGLFMLSLCYVISGSTFGYLDPIFGPQLKKLGQSPTRIGLLFCLYSGVYALLAPLLGWIADKTRCFRGMLIFGFTSFGVAFLLLGPAPFLTFLPDSKMWLVYMALTFCGLSGAFSFVPIMPDLIKTARLNGMPNNSSTNAVLSTIFGSMYYLGATIGPTIAGICDEHFGFQWATSVAAFMCFGHVILLSAFTIFENSCQRKNCDSHLLQEEEESEPLQVSSLMTV